MADVKWIKIVTDIFDDEKMLLIESLPDADGIIVIWFKLLCLAGKQNNSGVFVLNGKIPYTDEMLATIFRRPVNSVRLALSTFAEFGMIEIIDDVITIPNWEKHQNIDQMEKMKEQNRERVARHRAKQKLLAGNGECNVTRNVTHGVTVTLCNATDKIREDKKEIREEYKEDILLGAETPPTPPATHEAPASSPVVIEILLNDGSKHPVTQEDVDEWSNLYQAVDVMQELRKMKGWAIANPKKRKTKRGIKSFINSWLTREQDKYHGPELNTRVGTRQSEQSGNVFMDMLREEREQL